MMELLHYRAEPLVFEQDKKYTNNTKGYVKPAGFWVSVKGRDDWENWCKAEDFNLISLKYIYDVKLSHTANVLIVSSKRDMDFFQHKYSVKKYSFFIEIAWELVQKDYDGIIISPYQWTYRLHPDFMWYYGWDCASGVIWSLRSIKEVALYE